MFIILHLVLSLLSLRKGHWIWIVVGYWVTTTHYEIPIYGGPFGGLWGFLDKTKYISLGPQVFWTNVLTCAPTFRDMRKPSMRLVITKIPIFGGPFWGVPWGVSDKTKDFLLGPRAFRTNVLTCAPTFRFCAPNPNSGGLWPSKPPFLVPIKKHISPICFTYGGVSPCQISDFLIEF